MGYSELCLNRDDLSQEEEASYLKIIYDNSLRANYLITDLFQLSKMESTEFRIRKTKIDICEYVRAEIVTAITSFDTAGFTYDFEIPDREIYAEIDPMQMSQLFQNLTANTLQYNPKGTEVTVELSEEKEEVIIIFRDNGIGIQAGQAENIFHPFIRVDITRNFQTGGTGLGLAIVEKIVTAHGGSITLRIDEDSGCEFVIRLPKV